MIAKIKSGGHGLGFAIIDGYIHKKLKGYTTVTIKSVCLNVNVISSCYHMSASAIWYLSFEIFFIARVRSTSAINKIEKDKYHIARALIMITSLSYGAIDFFY